MMGARVFGATGIIFFFIGLGGFLWPRREARRPLGVLLMVNGVALCVAGALPGGGGDGRAAALLMLGLLPVLYLMAASLWHKGGQ
ncbi:MAG: hypothetical protein ACLFV5_05150 [Anaerolineales bacterium]